MYINWRYRSLILTVIWCIAALVTASFAAPEVDGSGVDEITPKRAFSTVDEAARSLGGN